MIVISLRKNLEMNNPGVNISKGNFLGRFLKKKYQGGYIV